MKVWIVVAALVIVGCGKKPPVTQPTIVKVIETVEVRVPVPIKVEPPAELLQSLKVPIPVFVAPSDPLASSALTVEGERLLRALIEDLLGKLKAWEEWAKQP
jgi:hypothetical protein